MGRRSTQINADETKTVLVYLCLSVANPVFCLLKKMAANQRRSTPMKTKTVLALSAFLCVHLRPIICSLGGGTCLPDAAPR
jgi:hypothetical protein